MRSHKLRSFLALFGIVWGTVAVVVLLALGQGFYGMGKASMDKLSSGMIFAIPRTTTLPFSGLPQGQALHVKASDVTKLSKALDVKLLSPKLRTQAKLTFEGESQTHPISGVSANFADINTIVMKNPESRYLNENDEQLARRVVVLGEELAESLFKHKDPVNETLSIQGLPFLVVGVTEKSNTGFNFGEGQSPWTATIPFTTFINIWGDIDIAYFVAVPDNIEGTDALKKAIARYFAFQHHFDPNDSDAIYMPDVMQMARFFDTFFASVKWFLGFCGAMTLGVGGVGVANIMFLIITERTREIGLRMALGATRYQILKQILVEAFLIVMLGATIGFGLSWLMIAALSSAPLPSWLGTPMISMSSVYSTIVILSIVALLAGFFPARRASKLDPVVALSS